MVPAKRKTNPWIKVARFFAKTILFIILFFLLIALALHIPFVQRVVKQKVVAYLERKLDTKVTIGKVYIDLPKNVMLKDVYVEDQKKDTLLSGGTLKANINLWQLVIHNNVKIESIGLENITAKIKRELPDTVFNYQFIADAFGSKSSSSASDTSSSALNLGNVTLDKVNLTYNDVVVGSYVKAIIGHLDTRIDTFDPINLYFDISKTTIDSLTATISQVKPLANPQPVIVDSTIVLPPTNINIDFKNATLNNIHINYKDDIIGMYTKADIGTLKLKPGNINLVNQTIDVESVNLENSVLSFETPKKEQVAAIVKDAANEVQTLLAIGWRINIGSMNLANNTIQFNDDNIVPVKSGFDYTHLNAAKFSLEAEDIILNDDSASGKIRNASFAEQNGFVLDKLNTDFLYTSTGASFTNVYVKTPGSELQNKAVIRYASPKALVNDIGNIELDLDLQDSKLLVKDLLTFAPQLKSTPAFAYPNATWFIDTKINGRVKDMQIDKLKINGLNDTRIDVAGSVKGLPNMNNLQADLSINNISSSKKDIQLFIPAGSLPENITLPGRFNTNGELTSNNGALAANLRINTDLGNAALKGTFDKIADPINASYNVTVNSSNMNIGAIIQNKEFSGPVSATIVAIGKGYDMKTATAKLDAVVHSAIVHQYTYKNIDVHAAIANQHATMSASLKDPNIDFALNGKADLTPKFPAIQITGMVDSIKFQPLHFASQNIIFRGKVDANIPVSDPNNLEGTVYLTQALFVNNDKRLKLDSVEMIAGKSDAGQFIKLNSDIATASLEGTYQLSQMPVILQNAIQPYFAIAPARTVQPTTPYNFTLNAYVADNPALKEFVTGLERLDSVSLQSHFSDSAWTATINAGAIDLNGNHLRNVRLNAGTGANVLNVTASIGQFQSGSNIQLNNTSVVASIANNKIDFDLINKDKSNKDKYHIKGLLQQPQLNNYELSLSSDNLILNYDTWTVSTNNKIVIAPNNIQATNFTLSKNGQQLTINSLSQGLRAPLQVDFANFQLSTITGFIQTDSTFANGTINGKLVFTDVTKPLFTTDLIVNDFSYMGDTVGNVHAVVSNKDANSYNTNIDLTGRGNDVRITGNYYVKGANNLDLKLDITTLPLATIQALSNNKIRNASGSVNGSFAVSGNLDQPVIIGDLNFNKAAFNFSMLNSYFSIDNEKLSVNEQGIRFNNFQIKDSANNPLTIDGIAGTKNFVNYDFDLDVRAENFKALNSTKRDNRLYYGQLYFNTNLKINGTETAPKVDGRLVINDKTKMTVVLPQQEPGVVQRDGIIEFVDKDAPLNDSLFLASYDSMNNSGFTGMDIAVNISIDPEAEFNLIIDEGNGDFLNVKGEAALTAGVDPSGKITLTGSYELEQGSYELTFNLLKRKFNIEKGSRITWNGEPTNATLDIKAVYIANAAPLDLVKDQLGEATAFTRNTYLQKLPFDVHLDMQGQLMQPQITFDIILPDTKNYGVAPDILTNVRTRLDELRQETGEMNKQVFSLLLLNRFITENPFSSSSSGGPNPAALARQSVSKLLTEQLNNLAGDLIAGVDINFDVASSEDYTTGERRDRTDLNVGLSKRLLNDRLTVSVGSNFELEGPQSGQTNNIAGNLAVDYRISKDNRYVLRAYRKNEYQGVIEGYVIETGVGFIINIDYNRFREIFITKKEREQRRIRRQAQQKLNEEQQSQKQATDSVSASR